MTEDERLNHAYLGDGVYAESTPEHIILRTGDHRDSLCDNKIYLDKDVLFHLVCWLTDIKRINKPSIIQHVDLKSWFDRLGERVDQIMIDALEEAQRISENDNQ